MLKMNATQVRIRDLSERMESLFPEARVEFTAFPSGAAMLDVVRNERLFVMSYSTTHQCFGVDEVQDDEGFLPSYKYVFDEFDPAADQMVELLKSVKAPQKALA